MTIKNDTFTQTLAVLEQAFKVSDIATFDLVTCGVDDQTQQVFDTNPQFDHIPVQDKGTIIGVLERSCPSNEETIRARMYPLQESMLVSSDMALGLFLPLMSAESFYRLALRDSKICGIVTRSDVLKLPVRLFAFARVTHLETVMAQIIQRQCPQEESWLLHLSDNRRKKIQRERDDYKKDRDDPSLLEFTYLWDKFDILKRICGTDELLTNGFEDIKALRNQIAHANNFAEDNQKLSDFIRRMKITEDWIEHLSEKYLSPA